MKAPLAFGLISLGVLAFACTPRDTRPRGTESSTALTPRIESALAVNAQPGAGAVRFDFSVTNAGGGKVEMHFPTGQTHDLVVLDTLGREVWRWSKGRMFTQLIQNKILRNADTLAFDESWKNAPRGQYVAVAQLASGNFPIEQRTPFSVR